METAGATAALEKTPLHSAHRASGAKMVDFGGWDMPVEYSGIIDEHMAVRTRVGLFDVSHMGEIEIRGSQALELLEWVTPGAVSPLQDNQAQYTALLYPQGTFVDDILVHRLSAHHYLLCVNASNQKKDFQWIAANNRFDAAVEYASEKYAQLAIQGPQALATLQKLTSIGLAGIRYYWFTHGNVCGVPALIARTGYTGEDGIEIYVPPDEAERIWRAVLEAGKEFDIRPCGLGARNTLRLEARMALYGHEIDASITPYEAGLGRIVKLDKGDFIGRDALVKQKEKGATRKLAGFEMRDRGIAREGYMVLIEGLAAGFVTSGSFAPYLKKNIGLCYLPTDRAAVGQMIAIQIRKQAAAAQVAPTPFYSRKR
ncbi:MAG: glycine cleavage system aminomethyltransferase GcvT [Acidobacteria bacterium]|nr:glycine cleavage system aminomethyltransferase GcvT [Acidobacteriota bacterium]